MISSLARLLAFGYYRIRYRGVPVPRSGPALLVANHPNSLIDPLLVLAAARRPVRLLAKSTLFPDPKTGWLMRLAGAIPVYRRSDDPAQTARNAEMFAAVHAALAEGAAVGLFPEGVSHSAPSLAPLRTGAARIALGAAAMLGRAFPVIPVGLVFREKETFRSSALVVTGAPIAWDDLALRGEHDEAAVRDLTARIAEGIAALTLNLETWQDRPLVEGAVAIHEATRGALSPEGRVAAAAFAAEILRARREAGDARLDPLARDVARHLRRLARLGLRPADLEADVGAVRGARWAALRLPLLSPLWAAIAAAGWVLFLVPYQLTGRVVDRFRLETDTRSTWKLLLGLAIYAAWVLLLTVAAWWGIGAWALASPIVLPAVGMAGLLIRERWRGAWSDVRRYVLLRSRRSLAGALGDEQRALADRLDVLLHEARSSG